MMHLLNSDGTVWGRAAFSIANAPIEATEKIEIAIKMYGDYTKRAATLRVGDRVLLQGPYGVFVLRSSTELLVLFAGGIGITPLRCMLRQILLTGDQRSIILFYSNKTRSVTAYEQEFRELTMRYPQFKSVLLLTQESPESWDGVSGRVSEDLVQRILGDFQDREYFMCGPNEFMDSIKMMLIKNGVDVKIKMRKESFG